MSSTSKRIGEANNISVQDEARSFRSKVDAMKFMTKNIHSRYAFRLYLEKNGGVEFLMCYIDLEEIKMQTDEHIIPIAISTLSKYEMINEEATRSGKVDQTQEIELVIWEKMRRLRQLDMKNTTRKEMVKCVNTIQSQLLAELASPFEGFLQSPQYRDWNQHQVKSEGEKHKTQTANGGKAIPVNHRVGSGKLSHHGTTDGNAVRPFSPMGGNASEAEERKLVYPLPAALQSRSQKQQEDKAPEEHPEQQASLDENEGSSFSDGVRLPEPASTNGLRSTSAGGSGRRTNEAPKTDATSAIDIEEPVEDELESVINLS